MNFDWKALVVAVDGDVGVVGVFVVAITILAIYVPAVPGIIFLLNR